MILENFFQSSLSSKEVILSFPFDLFLNLVLLDEVVTESEKNLCDLIFNYIQFREDKEVVEIAMKDEDVVSGVEKEWTNTLNNIKSKFTIKALNTQEKRSLIEAIRFSHMSHVEIIEASKNPVMIQHQDLILEALSARLENYENILDDNKLLKLNLKPRKYTRTLLLTSTENKVEIKLSSTISTKEDKKNPLQLTENFNSIIDYPIPPQNESHNPIILNGNDWIELRYKYDYDTCGLFYYLGTLGNRTAYKNPHEIGQVIACASSIGKGKLSDIVGRDLINFRTLNEENAFVGVDLGDGRSFIPTSYSIRNRNSPQHVMVSWSLEGSNDRINFEVLDRRCFCYEDKDLQKKYEKMRNALTVPGRITTWGVDPNVRYKHPYGFRYIYLRQIERNSSGSYNLAISGIELYGYYRGII